LSDERIELTAHTITAVERQQKKRQRYNIFLDEEYAFSVHEDILIKHRLLKGEVIDRDRMESILKDEELQDAMRSAIAFVGRKPRSAEEVQQKLNNKGYAEELIQPVIKKLKEQNIINDGEFAKTWTEHRIVSQKKGRQWVKMELLQKGVSKENIKIALEQVDEEAEYDSALQQAKKKWKPLTGSIRERKHKITSYLLRRGYTNSVVGKVLNNMITENGDDEGIDEDYP
jgi:regulatory protein